MNRKTYILALIFFVSSFVNAETVICEATLRSYVSEYSWYKQVGGSFDDGVAPLAIFTTTPSVGCGIKEVKVLFKSKVSDKELALLQNNIDGKYLIGLPADFFNSNVTIIEKQYVSSLVSNSP